MKKITFLLILVSFTAIISCNRGVKVEPPVAEKIPHELFDNRTDNYYWMRLSDEQKNAAIPDDQTKRVLDYLKAENKYASEVMSHTEDLQKTLFDEMVGRIKQDDESVPYFDNGYYYYNRYVEGKEYPVYYRRKGSMDAEEELLLDVNRIAEGHDYCAVTGLDVSRDNRILAYGVDLVSRRRYTLYFMDLVTRELLPDVIENTTGDVTWAADNKTLFYTSKDMETLRANRINRHSMGTSEEDDQEVYFEADETFSVYLTESKSRKYIFINSEQTLATETRYLDAMNPRGDFRLVEPRRVNHEYHVDHLGDAFYIRTNADSSFNFKLITVSDKDPSEKNWVDLIPHRKDVLFEGFELFNDFLVADERIKGLTNIRIINNNDGSEHYIDFGEETYTAGISTNPSPGTDILRYRFSSLITPNSVIDYNMVTHDKKLMKQDEVLGGFSSSDFESKRLWARAFDGTEIPISLVYRKGFRQDGKAPLLLYAYGSYGYTTDAGFRSNIISLLDRGFAFAIAHVRGGSEMGRYWYEDGKLFKKKNTFTDFNDCAQYLIDEHYTSTRSLFAQGGSAGGLLMGAILNMKPELYKGVIASVPFVDVVTTMLDPSIPLTTFEWDEWGDPRKKEYYDYMLSYSPYDQVQAQKYPNIIATAGFWDSQVQYWEPAKWVARLRDMKKDHNLLVFECNMSAGHGGASGRFERLRITALQYAFICDLAGIKE